MDRTGQKLLGKYELTRVLGKGGMGEVWEGEHTLTGRKVAVKILSENYLSNRKVVARFGREARAASSVNHAGIVEILDQDKTDDGVPFLVMEFLEGESVGERIRKLGKLSQDEALAIMLPLLDALDSAHQAGVIHRDLKPDNVFILPGPRGEERIKILDFGISQKADEIEHGLTQEGSVLGTPHYMSPEQARGESGIDARVDVYAAGVMFYECVVGDVPFDAGNYNALLQIILTTPPPSPRSRGADISPAVEQVLLAAMDKDRDKRPPTVRVFHDLLLEASVQEEDALLDTTTWTFYTPSEPPPPPVDFGDGDDDPTIFSAPPKGLESLRAQPNKAPAKSAPKPAPLPTFADDELEADLFSKGLPAAPRPAPPRFESLRPDNTNQHKPLVVPPPRRAPAPPPAFDAGPPMPPARAPFEPPMPARHSPFDGPRSPLDPMMPRSPLDAGPRPLLDPGPRGKVDSAPFPARPMIEAAPRMGSQRPLGERPRVNFTTSLESDRPSLGRTIGNWLLVVVAIAALGYLVRVIAARPDPRKRRAAEAVEAVERGTQVSEQGGAAP